ncbi:hypothetical protein [Streptomyces sp. NPDC020917]|uniref:hypothetical protein n=1 Tax=Streptomyces sp. NPDC020917 TaxID=3365102 RepID=UPI0037A81A87
MNSPEPAAGSASGAPSQPVAEPASAHDEREQEQELRALLERAVPQLPAPAQRLESLRARLRRRRRRRAAGLSGAAALAVALAALLVPGVAGRGPVPSTAPGGPTAIVPPASGGGPTTTGGPAPTADASVQTRHFADLGGLDLRLPRGWPVLAPGGSATAWVASQALALPQGGCANALDDFCTPLQRVLEGDGVLIQLAFQLNQGMADKARFRHIEVGNETVVTACRSVGGTVQLGTQLTDRSGSAVVVVATACLSHPGPAQLARVRDVLTTADFT